jgi:antitoxin PrlF
MTISTVTADGQVTIPEAVRVDLGLDAGSRVEFVEISKGKYAIVAATVPVRALKGMLRKPARPVTIEHMNEAIADQATKANDRP